MGNGVEQLSIHVKQALLLHQTDEQSLRGLVLLDDKNRLHVYPSSAISVVAQVARSTFIFTADPTSGILTGFSLRYSTPKVFSIILLHIIFFYPTSIHTNFKFAVHGVMTLFDTFINHYIVYFIERHIRY